MKSRSMGYLVVSLVVASLSPQLMGADYSKEMRKAFEKAFKGDFKQYQFFGTPVSNFGVATMYPKPATGNAVDLTTVGLFGNPENWWVPLSLTDADRQSLLNALRPSGETGAVAFQLDTSKTFNLSAVLPGLAKLLTASGSVSWSKKVTVRLSADTMINRRIDWTVLADDVTPPPKIKDSVLRHIGAKDFVITTGDVVLNNYKASLVVAKNLSVDEKAQLDSAWKAFSSGSKLDVSFSSGEDGNFQITSPKPVVVAVFVGEPPPGAVRDAKQNRVVPAPLSQKSIDSIALHPGEIPSDQGTR